MINETKLAYAEVDKILDLLEEEYVERIPEKIRMFFREEKNNDYIPNIEAGVSLLEQNLKRETFSILTILELNYWCDSEEEKVQLLKEIEQNEEEHQKELYEKYNPDNIFKKKNEENHEKVALVEYKEQSFIKKILNKIIASFKIK